MKSTKPAIIIFGVIVGLVLGFGGAFFIYNPQLNSLTQELKQKTSVYDSLYSDYTTLSNQYSILSTASRELSNAYDTIKIQVDSDTALINKLNADYKVLLNNYNVLYEAVKLVNGPSSKFLSLSDLKINVATNRSIYNYTESITGVIEINHKTGLPFKGTVELNVKASGRNATYGGLFNVNGKTPFTISKPIFLWGPGNYLLQVTYIKDSNGFIIAGPDETGSLNILLTVK
jgi:hypothetical protein